MNTLNVLAHGVGARGDLPLPVWQVVWGAAIALVASFAGLGLLWTSPRLAKAAKGRELVSSHKLVNVGEWVLRAVGLVLWGVTITAALFGTDNQAVNIAPVAMYVIFWVGLQAASAIFGDFWSRMSPFDTIAAIVRREKATESVESDVGDLAPLAVVSMLSFLWLELAYHTPASPRAIGVFLAVYSIVMIGGGIRFGRGWLRQNDGFVALGGLLGAMAPLFRRNDGTIGRRLPFVGLATVRPNKFATAFILVVLGSTTFDGSEGIDAWNDLLSNRSDWDLVFVNTLAILWVIAAVAAVYFAAAWVTARFTNTDPTEASETFASSLVPIVLAYSIAHYFSLFVFEGQNFLIQASDPYGQGWDLFGTQNNSVDFLLVSTATIAWVQVGSIVLGHIVGVTVAHDKAIERHTHSLAIKSQYPMLAAMVAFTVTGLILLLNA